MLNDGTDDFSFSGLKTAVRYHLEARPESIHAQPARRNLCASIQAAIVEVLVSKTVRAARRLRVGCVSASGGVICNRTLRSALDRECAKFGLRLRLAGANLCSDNAAMIGACGWRRWLLGHPPAPLDSEVLPDWELGS